MSLSLDTDNGLLSLRLGRLLVEYRRHVRLHHGAKMAHWIWRWLPPLPKTSKARR